MQNSIYPRQLAQPAAASQSKGPVQKVAFALVNIYLFIVISRLFDVTFSALRIPMVFFILALLSGLFGGNLLPTLRSRFTLILAAMLVWVGLAVIFSSWRGGSTPFWLESFQDFLLAVAIMSTASGFRDCIRLMYTIAFAVLTAALLSFLFGVYIEGRLSFYQGTYGDPNQYAMGLLIGLPCWVLILKRVSFFKKVLCLLAVGIIFFVFFRTGSRGGALGLSIVGLAMLFQASAKQRIVVLCAGVVLLILAPFFLPDYLKARYFTFLSVDSSPSGDVQQQEHLSSDAASAEGRLQLIWDALRVTAQHPLIGVGPGQFAQRRWEEAQAAGKGNVGYFVTHNSYTQMSSETGVPGLIILIILLYNCFKAIRAVLRLRRSRGYLLPQEAIDAGMYLRLAFIGLSVCAFFLSVAYTQLFYIMATLSAVYYRAAEREHASWKVQTDRPAQSPRTPVTMGPPRGLIPHRLDPKSLLKKRSAIDYLYRPAARVP